VVLQKKLFRRSRHPGPAGRFRRSRYGASGTGNGQISAADRGRVQGLVASRLRKTDRAEFSQVLERNGKNFLSRFLGATTPVGETQTAHRRGRIEQEAEVRHVER